MDADQNVCMTLSLVMKVGFTITIWRRSVKVKFELQEITRSQPKFVDNVLFTNIGLQFSLWNPVLIQSFLEKTVKQLQLSSIQKNVF